jgi:hypothetical protein
VTDEPASVRLLSCAQILQSTVTVRLLSGEAEVRSVASHRSYRKTIYLEMTQKGRSDIMPIPDIMLESLMAYAKHLRPNDRLFVKLSNSPWRRQDVLRIARTFGDQLGIQEATPRRLHNTVARQLRKNGAALDQVRNLLRHAKNEPPCDTMLRMDWNNAEKQLTNFIPSIRFHEERPYVEYSRL